MSKSVEYWKQYLIHVERSLGDFGEDTPVILTYGMASEICEVFDVTQREIIKGKDFPKERISELGDVLWYIAALELFYSLPHPRYANYLGIPFEITNAHGINLVKTQSEALGYASEISHAMTTGDADEIQYNLNKMLAIVFDVCMVYGINIIECLQSSVNKIAKRHPNGYDKDAEKNHDAEYKATKASIKADGCEEILIKIKLDHRSKGDPYKRIEVTGFGEIHKFEDGDIIADFFRASNFIYDTYGDKDYLINYSPNFRALLNDTVDDLFTGYIINGEIFSAAEMIERMKHKAEGNVIRLSKREARPILMTPDIKTLPNLLDHVNKVRGQNK
jgi:NTP pyrophosphatase (non-canonical NTP hydrolase)